MRLLAEQPTKGEDLRREVGVRHRDIAPDELQELFFGDQLPAAPNEGEQNLEPSRGAPGFVVEEPEPIVASFQR